MNKEIMTKAVKASISEVLEKMFFLPLEFAGEKSPAELWPPGMDEGILVVGLTFQGQFTGQFHFFIPKVAALSLAASFLGESQKQITQEQVMETVKEILNMIAGNAFGLYDEKAVFNLGIPQVGDYKKSKIPIRDPAKRILLMVDTLEQSMVFQLVWSA